MKKLSKIFAVVLVLAMALSMLPMSASAAAEEKYVELTVDSMGLAAQSYADGNATVNGIAIAWAHVGNYGDGIQMRDKIAEGKGTSAIWNTAAMGKITKIELTYSDSKDTYDNPDCMIWNFGGSEKGADYTTKLTTAKGNKSYTITPEGDYSFFYLEWDYNYTSYWKSIKVYYTENAGTVEPPKEGGDHSAIVAMTSVMAIAVVAMAVLVLGKKKFF